MFGRRRHCRERTSDAEQVDYLLLGAACWHRPQPTRNVRTAAVTCDDTRTLKFTLIVQRMPMSGRWLSGRPGFGRLSDMFRIARHPLATSLVCVLAAFIVVDGTRRIVDQQARAYHGWAVAVLLALVAYAIAVFILVSSARGRQRLHFDGARAGSVPVILLAIAWSPVLLSAALVYFGAPTWCLWLAFVVFCVLVGAWYKPAAACANGLNRQPCAGNALLCRAWYIWRTSRWPEAGAVSGHDDFHRTAVCPVRSSCAVH